MNLKNFRTLNSSGSAIQAIQFFILECLDALSHIFKNVSFGYGQEVANSHNFIDGIRQILHFTFPFTSKKFFIINYCLIFKRYTYRYTYFLNRSYFLVNFTDLKASIFSCATAESVLAASVSAALMT